MKVRVSYLYEISDEEYKDLCRYHGNKVSRSDLKHFLEELGKSGVEENIRQGGIWRDVEVEP